MYATFRVSYCAYAMYCLLEKRGDCAYISLYKYICLVVRVYLHFVLKLQMSPYLSTKILSIIEIETSEQNQHWQTNLDISQSALRYEQHILWKVCFNSDSQQL